MPREPVEDEENKMKFARPDYPGRHNITRLDKRIMRAFCNDCCEWVSVKQLDGQPASGGQSFHCKRSYNMWKKRCQDQGMITNL